MHGVFGPSEGATGPRVTEQEKQRCTDYSNDPE